MKTPKAPAAGAIPAMVAPIEGNFVIPNVAAGATPGTWKAIGRIAVGTARGDADGGESRARNSGFDEHLGGEAVVEDEGDDLAVRCFRPRDGLSSVRRQPYVGRGFIGGRAHGARSDDLDRIVAGAYRESDRALLPCIGEVPAREAVRVVSGPYDHGAADQDDDSGDIEV